MSEMVEIGDYVYAVREIGSIGTPLTMEHLRRALDYLDAQPDSSSLLENVGAVYAWRPRSSPGGVSYGEYMELSREQERRDRERFTGTGE